MSKRLQRRKTPPRIQLTCRTDPKVAAEVVARRKAREADDRAFQYHPPIHQGDSLGFDLVTIVQQVKPLLDVIKNAFLDSSDPAMAKMATPDLYRTADSVKWAIGYNVDGKTWRHLDRIDGSCHPQQPIALTLANLYLAFEKIWPRLKLCILNAPRFTLQEVEALRKPCKKIERFVRRLIGNEGHPLILRDASDNQRYLELLSVNPPEPTLRPSSPVVDTDDGLDAIADALDGQSLKLWQFLVERKHWTAVPQLADLVDCWRKKPPSDAAVDKALRRLQADLNEIDNAPRLSIDRSSDPRRTKLDKE